MVFLKEKNKTQPEKLYEKQCRISLKYLGLINF